MLKKQIDYFKSHYINRYWVLSIDTVSSILSSVFVFFTLDYFTRAHQSTLQYCIVALVSFTVSLFSFIAFKTSYGVLRHSTLREMWRVSAASFLKGVAMIIMAFLLKVNAETGFSQWKTIVSGVLDSVITLVVLMMIRVIISNMFVLLKSEAGIGLNQWKNILIYGQGDESVSSIGMVSDQMKGDHFKVIGFVVCNPQVKNSSKNRLCGFPVFVIDDEHDFQRICFVNNINAILFPNYKSARDEKNRVVNFCIKMKVEILIRPSLGMVESDGKIIAPIREVKIEDLLGREQVEINMGEINNFLTDKVVLVTGAAGSIGSELCRLLLTIPLQKLILLDFAETPLHNIQLELKDKAPTIEKKFIIADVRSHERIDSIFQRYTPNVVFHAAAYKHVPMMESNPCEAVNVNVFGTMTVADASVRYGVEKFVMISTDKAVNPANVMGASKRIAEIYVQSLSRAIASGKHKGHTKFITTRFGNVLGSNGSVIPLFRDQIASGGPVTVTDPRIIRYFMTVPEACRLVMEASMMGKGDEIFVFDMGEPVKIQTLAENMIKLAGLKPGEDIDITYCGLRPGEKLYEELLTSEENTIPTPHKKIFLAKTRTYDFGEITKELSLLNEKSKTMSKDDTVSVMKCIVPEFISCNSRYSKFDGK